MRFAAAAPLPPSGSRGSSSAPAAWPEWQHDLGVCLASSAIPLALVLLTEVLKDKNSLSAAASRKLLHIATGPLFLLTTPLYSAAPSARFLAALLPGLMSLRFALAGLGVTREPRLVAGTARSGRRQELLAGPLQYGLAHTVLTVVAWRQPASVAGIAALCAGDGLADVVGRHCGVRRLPFTNHKTWLGSSTCCVAAFSAIALLLLHFQAQGLMMVGVPLQQLLLGSALASLAATVAELSDVDNVTVPLAAALVALWWFSGSSGGGAVA